MIFSNQDIKSIEILRTNEFSSRENSFILQLRKIQLHSKGEGKNELDIFDFVLEEFGRDFERIDRRRVSLRNILEEHSLTMKTQYVDILSEFY